MNGAPLRTRWAFGTKIAIVLGAVALALGALSFVVEQSYFDANGFAERTAASLSDPAVAGFAADSHGAYRFRRQSFAMLEESFKGIPPR